MKRHAYTLADRLEASKVHNWLDGSELNENLFKFFFITNVKLPKENHTFDLARDLLHSIEADSTAIAQIINNHDFCEAAMTLSFKKLDNGMWADVTSASCDEQCRSLTLASFFDGGLLGGGLWSLLRSLCDLLGGLAGGGLFGGAGAGTGHSNVVFVWANNQL